jgi:hypothetical protein
VLEIVKVVNQEMKREKKFVTHQARIKSLLSMPSNVNTKGSH